MNRKYQLDLKFKTAKSDDGTNPIPIQGQLPSHWVDGEILEEGKDIELIISRVCTSPPGGFTETLVALPIEAEPVGKEERKFEIIFEDNALYYFSKYPEIFGMTEDELNEIYDAATKYDIEHLPGTKSSQAYIDWSRMYKGIHRESHQEVLRRSWLACVRWMKNKKQSPTPASVQPNHVQEAAKLPGNIKRVIKIYQNTYPSAFLTGTCALMLYGFNLGRTPNDIDFILPNPPTKIPKDWMEVKMPDGFQAKCYETDLLGVKTQFIIWDEYDGITIDGINVTSIFDLIEEKKNLGLTGTKKHLIDFHKMLIQLLSSPSWQASHSPAQPQEAIEFAEWISNNQFTVYNTVWASTKIHYLNEAYTTSQLYEIFKKQKEK